MSTENGRNDFADLISKLSPEKRLRLEDLVVQAIFREDNARREAADPVGYREGREAAEAFVRTLGDAPLSPEAAAGLRRSCAILALKILRERSEAGGPGDAADPVS